MDGLKGKVIFITGASSGIGEACARRFAGHACELILAARREQRLSKLKDTLQKDHGVGVTVETLDVRDRAAVGQFADRLRLAAVFERTGTQCFAGSSGRS